jgi:hypothetical protein
MKTFFRTPILQVLLLPLLAFSCREPGLHSMGENRVVLPVGEIHQGWYFAGGDNVIINGTVNGDAFVAAGLVEIAGTINGELFVAGGQVDVSGSVADRIVAAGGVIRLTGKTGKSVIAAGGSVVLGRNGTVGENFLGAGGNLMIDGTIGGDARLASGEVVLAGEIKGNVEVAAERVLTEKGADIGGNLTIATRDSNHVNIAPGTTHGKLTVKLQKEEVRPRILGMTPLGLVVWLLFMLSLLACALVLSFLFPDQTASIGTTIMVHPGQSALVGIATLILTPVLAAVLCITVIGIPLAGFAMMYYLWLMYLSQLSLGVALGSRLMEIGGKRGWALFGPIAIGVLIVEVLMFIPILNVLVVLAGLVFGVGALAILTREQYLSFRAD